MNGYNMEKETLTISLPRQMKLFIKSKLRDGRFSTPSEYIRSLVRSDQEENEHRELEALVRNGLGVRELPELTKKDWAAVQALVYKAGPVNKKRAPNGLGR